MREVIQTHMDPGQLLGCQIVSLLTTYVVLGVPIEGVRKVAERTIGDPDMWCQIEEANAEEPTA